MTVDFRKNGVAANAIEYRQRSNAAGKPYSAIEGVNLVAVVQDNARYIKDGEVKSVYVQFTLHPDDPRAKAQESLSLLQHDTEYNGRSKADYTVPITQSQFEALTTAAGKNVVSKLDKDGKQTGQIFGVKAAVFQVGEHGPDGKLDRSKPFGYMPVSTSFEASDLKVAGRTKAAKNAFDRGFELTAKNREAAKAVREAAKALEAEAPAQEAPVVEPELV